MRKGSSDDGIIHSKVHLSQSELLDIIKGIEGNGGDASILRQFYDSQNANGKATNSRMSDEDYIKQKYEQSEIQKGKALICSICNTTVDTLINGVCEKCFDLWMLSCRKD